MAETNSGTSLLAGYQSDDDEEDPLCDGYEARQAIARQFLDAASLLDEDEADGPDQEMSEADSAYAKVGELVTGQEAVAGKTATISIGKLVKIQGLQQAAALNGRVGKVQGPDPKTEGRWRVELPAEPNIPSQVKSFRGDNLILQVTPLPVPVVEGQGGSFWPGCRVRAVGLKQAQALNGCVGIARQPDASREGRWEVEFWNDSGTACDVMATIKRENLVLLEDQELEQDDVNFAEDGIDDDEDMDKGDDEDEDQLVDENCLEAGAEVKLVGLQSAAGSPLNGQLGTLLAFDADSGRWQVAMHNGASKAIKPENILLERSPLQGDQCEYDEFTMSTDCGELTSPQPSAASGKHALMDANELVAAIMQAELAGDDELLAGLKAEHASRGSSGVISGDDGLPSGSSHVTDSVEVPVEVVGAIIGKGGESIKRLSEESGAHMSFAREDAPEPGHLPLTRKCLLQGPLESVTFAKDLLQKSIAEASSSQVRGRRGKGGGKGKTGGKINDNIGAGAGGNAGFAQGICKWYAAGFCRNRPDACGGCRNGLHNTEAAIKAEADWVAQGPRTGSELVKLPPGKPLLLLLDLEGGGNADGRDGEDEIIEVPVLSMCPTTGVEFGRFHRFVRPGYWDREAVSMRQRFHTNCFNNGASSIPFPQVIADMQDWIGQLLGLSSPVELNGDSFLFVTCGNWDVKTAIPRQCNKPVPGAVDFATQQLMFSRWSNLKEVFKAFYKLPESSAPTGMRGMLNRLRIRLSGQHHLGMDDVSNLAKILQQIIREGCEVQPTGHAKMAPVMSTWKLGKGNGKKGGKRGDKGGEALGRTAKGKGKMKDPSGSSIGGWGRDAIPPSFPGPPPSSMHERSESGVPGGQAKAAAPVPKPSNPLWEFLSGAPLPGSAWGDSDDEATASQPAARPAARPGEDWTLFADEEFGGDEAAGARPLEGKSTSLPAPKRSAPQGSVVLGACPESGSPESLVEAGGDPAANEPPAKVPRIASLLASLPPPRANI
eukprot:TRINITY_DN30831_c0_g1_i1.p1 TRINITY_DN30831_c0_g1~~TRINITY_DN30831_c0_g1_i1.p1  ORF type:complete len:1001 (+),score=192.86 TRINITY_DN30831_c0_g1_i1:335-3337(+)